MLKNRRFSGLSDSVGNFSCARCHNLDLSWSNTKTRLPKGQTVWEEIAPQIKQIKKTRSIQYSILNAMSIKISLTSFIISESHMWSYLLPGRLSFSETGFCIESGKVQIMTTGAREISSTVR